MYSHDAPIGSSNEYNYGEMHYLELLDRIIRTGTKRDDRTGVGTYGIFAPDLTFDLSHGFPLLTTKKLSFHNIKHELLWFLNGLTNVSPLQENNVHIWDEWADEWGELGPVYGWQWRYAYETDQIADLVDGIITDPNSRRHIVTAWNPADISRCRLPPCHCMFIVYIDPETNKLNLHMTQRSADMFLGVPYNIASYALLTHMLARVTDKIPGVLKITFIDAHVYRNHLEQVLIQLRRIPLAFPTLDLSFNPQAFTYLREIPPETIKLEGFNSHEAIQAEIAI